MCVALLWRPQVNAVSLVNLAMALGIAVEFCAHVLHAYMVAAVPLAAAVGGQQPQQPQQQQQQQQRQRGQGQQGSAGGDGSAWSRLIARLRGGYTQLPAAAAAADGAAGGGDAAAGGGVWRLGFLGGPQRAARSRAALVSVGASVLSGVTLTKLVGVAVLAFARTQIFEVGGWAAGRVRASERGLLVLSGCTARRRSTARPPTVSVRAIASAAVLLYCPPTARLYCLYDTACTACTAPLHRSTTSGCTRRWWWRARRTGWCCCRCCWRWRGPQQCSEPVLQRRSRVLVRDGFGLLSSGLF